MQTDTAVITRDNQRVDTIYQVVGDVNASDVLKFRRPDDVDYFVTPDGEGRYYYETLDEAIEQHGHLPVVIAVIEED